MGEEKESEKITIQIVPDTEGEVFSFKIDKKWIKISFYFTITVLILLVGVLGYYYYQFNVARREIRFLMPYKQKVESLREKNDYLKGKLSKLSQETKQIREQFNQIKQENHKIKDMIDFEDEDIDSDDQSNAEDIDSDDQSNAENDNSDDQSDKDSNSQQTVENYFDQVQDMGRGGNISTPGILISNTKHNLSSLDDGITSKKEDLSNLKQEINNYKDYLASKPKGWPISGNKGKISSEYGYRFHPVEKKRMFHEGVDIGVWYNHKVVATGKAKVIFVGWKSGYGRAVILDHGYGYRTLYAHNNKVLVKTGEKVKRGEPIALSGNSGRSTGPHLHYEVLVNGKHTNPQKFF